jgi:hypothetical protein
MTLNDAKSFVRWLLNMLFAFFFVVWVLGQTPLARDDTDPGQWGSRSGMALKTDSLTGCQYLVSAGGITPRLKADGRHMGCRAG